MDLPKKQLSKLLGSAQNILVTGPKHPNVDVVSTAAAWWLFLSGKKKKVDVVFDGDVPEYDFFPSKLRINKTLENLNKFKIILDVSKTKVKQLSYDLQDTELLIDIVPENGVFSSEDVSAERGDYKYDLIIVLGAETLDTLGDVFSEHRHFFHSSPIINIDISVLNENFGQLNVVEANITSLAEISYRLLKNNLDKRVSTCLLAGMIVATNSFQSPKVSPETLELASQLIIQGAEREKIIESLYRTKDITTLKSWGKVLSRLKKQGNIISSHLNHEEVNNLPKDFSGMVKELILSSPGAQVAVIFYQLELYKTEVVVHTISNIDALELTKELKGSGHRRMSKVVLDKDMENSKDIILEKLAKKLDIINSV